MMADATVPPTPDADVVLVDDHPLLAQSLVLALRADGVTVTRCDELIDTAIIELVAAHAPTVVLLDLDLGGEVGSSLPLIPELTRLGATVLILTGVTDRVRLAECIEAGAVGLIAKSEPFASLVDAIHTARRTGGLLTREQRSDWMAELRGHRASLRARRDGFDLLTRREAEVLAALIEGWPAERIASEWSVSITTVRGQIRAILVKLGVNSQLAAVARAHRAGWHRDVGQAPKAAGRRR